MNHRSKPIIALLAATLSLLALPALAQNSGSSGSGSKQPSPSRSDRDQRPAPSDPLRPGSSSSTSGSSTSEVDSSRWSGSDMDSRSQVGVHGNISFDQLDTDGDGRISRTEYTSSSSFNQGGASARSSAPGQASTRGSLNSSGSQGGQDTAESFRRLDANGDGYLSRDEVKGGQLNRLHGKQQQSQP